MLLQALARAVGSGIAPTAGELLATVQEAEPSLFRNWTARAVAAHLKRYGILLRKTNGEKFLDPSPADLRRVQQSYGIDLDLPQPDLDPDQRALRTLCAPEWARQGTWGTFPKCGTRWLSMLHPCWATCSRSSRPRGLPLSPKMQGGRRSKGRS